MRWFRWFVALCAWGMAACLALAFAADTAIGPIVLVLTPTHGVHLGDVLACIASAAIALVITLLLLLPVGADHGTGRQ